MMGDTLLAEAVNKSGFPLQLKIKNLLSSTDVGWKVLHSEHAWSNKDDGEDGFIDLVLENKLLRNVFVVECKRRLLEHWIFLCPSQQPGTVDESRISKAWISQCGPERTNTGFPTWTTFNWHDCLVNPQCPSSEFCVVKDGKTRKPGDKEPRSAMLEGEAASLISATESFAQEESNYLEPNSLRRYFSLIVTTAELHVCSVDPSRIGLLDGNMDASSQFITVPFVTLRKQLSTRPPRGMAASKFELARRKTHSVFVVNSGHLEEFLRKFEFDKLRPT